jgi:regulator of sirC expression with transglutaminase-like and TPR domain
MKEEKWEKALSAFQRVIQIAPEEGEAWNNSASVYIHLNKL